MDSFLKKIFLTSLILGASIFVPHSVLAQTSGLLSPERRAELERQLQDLESQISDQRQILNSKQQQSASLQRDIDILNAKIKEAQLAIKARDLTIQSLSDDISNKQRTIGELSDKLDREKESLGQILRKTNELDLLSLPDFVLSSQSLSDFFVDFDTFNSVKQELQQSFAVVGATRDETESQKTVLEDKRSEQLELRRIQELQRQTIQKQQAEKNNLLKITKGQEKIYQQILAQKEKDAATIRTALFSLTGAGAIPFEKAYQYAVEVGSQTGLRPAFILGIIAEESNLGENVGTGNWKTDMHPTRDQPVFQTICQELGLNPDMMPVSKKAWYGWGGAMGPAQFIPSTWVLYKDRISKLSQSTPPNPWNPRDAFYAAGILLQDNGGAKGTRADERLAALRYLAGWKNASKPAYAFYGDEVMDLADKYQQQIDILKGSSN